MRSLFPAQGRRFHGVNIRKFAAVVGRKPSAQTVAFCRQVCGSESYGFCIWSVSSEPALRPLCRQHPDQSPHERPRIGSRLVRRWRSDHEQPAPGLRCKLPIGLNRYDCAIPLLISRSIPLFSLNE